MSKYTNYMYLINFFAAPPKNGNEWEIASCVKYQEMLGIGGALTDSVGINLGTLSQPARENLLK